MVFRCAFSPRSDVPWSAGRPKAGWRAWLVSLTLVLGGGFPAFAAEPESEARIISGPMLGWQEHREVLVWLETQGAEQASLRVWAESGEPGQGRRVAPSRSVPSPIGSVIHHFRVDALELGAGYRYAVELDGRGVEPPPGSAPLFFRSRNQWEWRAEPPEVHFLIGSCNYHNDPPYDRPGAPYGTDASIFAAMAKSGAGFLVWLGDNLYLRESDWTSRYGIFERFSKDRANPALIPLLGAMHHYATWDDHEFGPNDSGRSYELKDVTFDAMQLYFPSQSAGEVDNKGIYSRFKQGDAEFFILDGRYWRDNAYLDPAILPGKSILGERQRAWFLNALMDSKRDPNVAVRFVAVGSQFLNPFPLFENFSRYPEDRDRILAFIDQAEIPNVVFLTGDRHYAELMRLELPGGGVVYDFTSSSLTAGTNRRPTEEGERWEEFSNPLRVPGTLYNQHNFGSLRINGPRKERVLTLALKNREGGEVWSHAVPLK